MNWCLPTYLTNDFLNKLRSGEINPEKLMKMSSDERREFFDKNFGEEHGQNINRTFESKLLLKNQQQGIINWAKDMAGLKPEAQKDLISKVNKMTDVLNPENEKDFLKDYASYKLGTNVTMDEARNISKLAKDASEKKTAMDNGGDRFDYGMARDDLKNYIDGLKTPKRTFMEAVKDIPAHPGKAFSTAFGVAKSLKTTFTNAIVRHGLWTLVDSPEIWFKNSLRSFKHMWDEAGGKDVMHMVNADTYSRPNYLNGAYAKDKLGIDITEEALPNSDVLEKVPILGKIQKITSTAFKAFQRENRMDLYDKMYKILEDRYPGEKVTGRGAGHFVNSLTIRGYFGKYEGSTLDLLNKALFSPRYVKSQFDNLTANVFKKNVLDPVLRKRSAVNLVKWISANAAIITAVNKLTPSGYVSINLNPLKPNFGMIKIGDTRFDMNAGMPGMIVLASKLADQAARHTGIYKKAKEYGIINEIPKLTYKPGIRGGIDTIVDYISNKGSPAADFLKDVLSGMDFDKKPITLGGEVKNFIEPIPFTSYEELASDPNSANIILSILAEELGVTARTYSPPKPKVHL